MIRNWKKIIAFSLFALCASVVFFKVAHAGPQIPYDDSGEGGGPNYTCQVTSATFNPGMTWGVKSIVDTEGGPDPLKLNGTMQLYAPYFYPPASITINVVTQNCVGQKIYLRVYSDYDKGAQPEPELIDNLPPPSSDHFTGIFVVPSSGQFSVKLQTGEASCSVSGGSPNCSDYIAAGPNLPRFTEVNTEVDGDEYSEYVVTAGDYYSKYDQSDHSKPNTDGKIAYNCKGAYCSTGEDWKWNSDTSDHSANTNKITLQTNGTTNSGSCANDTSGDCYQLYDGLTGIFGSLGDKLTSFTQATSLGEFLNDIIAIIIGVAGVIAVVRIMYLGVVYMKSDNVTSKLTVRGAIIQTIGGFILLLLIYTILRTINPDLLNLTPSISTVKVTVIPPSTTQPSPTGTDTSGADTATTVTNVYIPARDQQLPNAPLGLKVLITAHTLMEGFSPKTVTYVTNNPGNIGTQINNPNVQLSSVTCPSGLSSYQTYSGNGNNWGCYPTLAQGIQGQANLAIAAASGTVSPYKVGGSNGYDGSLAEYLNLYEHGTTTADTNSTNYLNYFIKFFAQNGITVTGQTPLSQIVNGTTSS